MIIWLTRVLIMQTGVLFGLTKWHFIKEHVMWSAQHTCSLSNIKFFGDWTQSKPIKLNPWIELDWILQWNKIRCQTLCQFDVQTNQAQSNKSITCQCAKLPWLCLNSSTKLNQTHSSRLHLISCSLNNLHEQRSCNAVSKWWWHRWDWVRTEFDWNLFRLGSIDYAGQRSKWAGSFGWWLKVALCSVAQPIRVTNW